jgi:hypothetical protein
MFYGKPTGAAMPLMWAHAEYLKLLRSTADGVVFDLIPEVAERYDESKFANRDMEKKSEDSIRHATLQTAHPTARAVYSAL